MKKIVNHPKGLRLESVVENDGVGFLPVRELGPMAMQTSGFFATAGEDECIECKIFNGDEKKEKETMAEKIKAYANRAMLVAGIAIVACLVLMFVCAGFANPGIWINAIITIVYAMFIVMLMPKAAVVFWGKLTKNEEMLNFSKYLGAKNAVENAYYDLGRAPNMEEVKEYSTHSSECEYTKNGYMACLVLLICLVRFLEGWWYWIAAILAIAVLCILEGKNKLTFWQELVVSKPAEEHYRVAIRAMEETSELIDSIQVSYHQVNVPLDPENFNEEKCEGCPAYDFCKEESQKLAKEGEDEAEEEGDNDPAAESGC